MLSKRRLIIQRKSIFLEKINLNVSPGAYIPRGLLSQEFLLPILGGGGVLLGGLVFEGGGYYWNSTVLMMLCLSLLRAMAFMYLCCGWALISAWISLSVLR